MKTLSNTRSDVYFNLGRIRILAEELTEAIDAMMAVVYEEARKQ